MPADKPKKAKLVVDATDDMSSFEGILWLKEDQEGSPNNDIVDALKTEKEIKFRSEIFVSASDTLLEECKAWNVGLPVVADGVLEYVVGTLVDSVFVEVKAEKILSKAREDEKRIKAHASEHIENSIADAYTRVERWN